MYTKVTAIQLLVTTQISSAIQITYQLLCLKVLQSSTL